MIDIRFCLLVNVNDVLNCGIKLVDCIWIVWQISFVVHNSFIQSY